MNDKLDKELRRIRRTLDRATSRPLDTVVMTFTDGDEILWVASGATEPAFTLFEYLSAQERIKIPPSGTYEPTGYEFIFHEDGLEISVNLDRL